MYYIERTTGGYNLVILRIVLLSVLLNAVSLFAAPGFTIEQVLSSAFPSDLTASPHGDAVAWIFNDKGVRNVWIARAPQYSAVSPTHFAVDDGQELDEIAWKADSTAVFFTRGGGVNGHGESPNPHSDPAGVHQEIWMASVGGDVRKVGDGHSAAVAPDGSYVAWVYSGQIWASALSGDMKPMQLVHARGMAEDLAWSPDSGHLAFTSSRGDHAFIGIYTLREKSLNFVDASVDSDQSPVWSADSKQVAFIRIPAARLGSLYGAKRTGQPWSIQIADAATGKGREIWRAQEGAGSVFWPVPGAHQLFWTGNGRIVFPWERDGWLHLYAIAVTGPATPTLLTPGKFEIEHACLARGSGEVIYASNQGDTERRHLWSVAVDGGAPKALTKGAGIEWSPEPLGDGHVAFLHSDARIPARPALLQPSGGVTELSALPPDFPSASLVQPEPVIFQAADGMPIHAQLFLPSTAASARHPAIVFFHGGSRRQMLLGWHSMFYYHQAYGFNQYLTSQGYVVLSVNYRSGVGYGEEFREAVRFGPTGASEFNDVLGAGHYLQSRADVDPQRIGVWGGSYGGYLAALGLSRASDIFAAGVDLHGVHDWNLEISNPIPVYEPEKRLAVATLAFQSSPMSSITTWKSPVLLIQGDDDRNVPFAETVQLAEALRKQDVHVEQLIFPDEIHDFLVHSHWLQAYRAAADFLNRFLH